MSGQNKRKQKAAVRARQRRLAHWRQDRADGSRMVTLPNELRQTGRPANT